MIFEENYHPPKEEVKQVETPVKKLSDYKQKEETKEDRIKEWNDRPEVKKEGIIATTKRKFKAMKTFAILGAICMIVFIVVGIVVGYTIFKDGSLKPAISTVCSPALTCPEIPAQTCPANTCNPITSNNITCPTPIVKVYLNETG